MLLTFLLTALLNTTPLEVMIMDSTLQRVVGYGKQSGNQLKVELLETYSGPVHSMFIGEKVTSIQGVLVGGQLTLTTNNGPTTLQQYLNTMGVNLKLTVLKSQKINVNADDNNGGNGNSGNGNSGNGNSGNGNSGNGNSGNGNSGNGNGGNGNGGNGNGGSGNGGNNGGSGNGGNDNGGGKGGDNGGGKGKNK
ncbi:hypothetical protein [Deinococcus misasensis]|uniref:hypothetical protein n=1 Tax=Deinococcus misasensis TaxID=392413 RepID=UPI00069089B8|nr:hypothetical protein [Deinococcus misasensis]